jgi:hypothetical protein
MSKRFIPAVALLVLLAASPVAAQTWTCTGVGSCSATQTASLTIPSLVSLDLGAGTFTLTAPGAADLATGYLLEAASPTITVKANKAWTLSVSAAAANFTPPVGGARPSSMLRWASVVDVWGTYTAMTNVGAQFASGAATNAANPVIYFGSEYINDFSDTSNVPGTYTLDLTFTLAAP